MLLQALPFAVILLTDVTFGKIVYYADRHCECGRTADEGPVVAPRILLGELAPPNSLPWVALILNDGKLHCEGTIINNRYILTAGHCLQDLDLDNVTIALGVNDLEKVEDGLIVNAKAVKVHEDFASNQFHDFNDIGLLKLASSIHYSDSIRPACLPIKGSEYDGHRAQISGWGLTKHKKTGLWKFLRRTDLTVIGHEECKNSAIGDHLDKNAICALTNDVSTWQGDSGGPLLHQRENGKHEIIGIDSWGVGCAEPGYPGAFLRVTEYLNWIYRNTRDSIYCLDV